MFEDIEITKIRSHRINFRSNGKLYSLNHHDNDFEDWLILWEKGDKVRQINCIPGYSFYGYIKLIPGVRMCEHGFVYKFIDKSNLIDMLNEFVSEV